MNKLSVRCRKYQHRIGFIRIKQINPVFPYFKLIYASKQRAIGCLQRKKAFNPYQIRTFASLHITEIYKLRYRLAFTFPGGTTDKWNQ